MLNGVTITEVSDSQRSARSPGRCSARRASNSTRSETAASQLYCFRSFCASDIGARSTAAPAIAPAARPPFTDPQFRLRTRANASAAAAPSKIRGSTRRSCAPCVGTSLSSNTQPIGVLDERATCRDTGALARSATHASSTMEHGADRLHHEHAGRERERETRVDHAAARHAGDPAAHIRSPIMAPCPQPRGC